MQKFEYTTIDIGFGSNISNACNKYAEEGWKVVTIWYLTTNVSNNYYALLEREFLNLPKGQDKRWKDIG